MNGGVNGGVNGVFAEHKNGLDIPAGKQAFRRCIQALGVFREHKAGRIYTLKNTCVFQRVHPALGGV